jgi:hypothetical protein
MTRGDDTVERAAAALEQAAGKAARQESVPDEAVRELSSDAEFLRKLKPSLVLERIRGRKIQPAPAAPSGPQLGERPADPSEGPSAVVVLLAAFAAGIVLAKLIDWRGHAHPRY